MDRRLVTPQRSAGDHAVSARMVTTYAGHVALPGTLALPTDGVGVVVFAHGSGSGRSSPRNIRVARALHEVGLGTLLFDLLTPEEAQDRRNVFDVPLLARRLTAAVESLEWQPDAAHLPVGLFGASTGAAAALWSAADLGAMVGAIVSRGGRPDLASSRLGGVTAPTLLIVGGRDDVVLELNRDALRALRSPARLDVIPGATHLFEEPGALERVAELAGAWFVDHLGDPDR